jgi:putative transposase
MSNSRISTNKGHQATTFKCALEEIAREGARMMLQQALENEIDEYIEQFKHIRNEQQRRMIVRNGYVRERAVQTGMGPISLRQPRVRDKRRMEKFTSAILPPYMRRTPSLEELIPVLYLKGISRGDFSEALEAILGKNAKGLSPTNIVRMKQSWDQEYKAWQRRDLTDKHYVYVWADAVYFRVRLGEGPALRSHNDRGHGRWDKRAYRDT